MSDYNDVRRIMGGEGYMNDEISRLTDKLIDGGCSPDELIEAITSGNVYTELKGLERRYSL